MNYVLNGYIDIKTHISDPNLPKGCKRNWVATGALIHNTLRTAYLNMIVAAIPSSSLSLDEAFLILSGKKPFVKNKRIEVGKHHQLCRHSKVLKLFGSLSHNIEGALKVGFIHKADETGYHPHTMRLNKVSEEEFELLLDIMRHWSGNLVLGDNSEVGFGEFSASWQVECNDEHIGVIKLSQNSFQMLTNEVQAEIA